MPRPRIAIKLPKASDQLRSNGVEVNVPNELSEIRILLAYDRFEAVLKEMAVPSVPKVVDDRVSG